MGKGQVPREKFLKESKQIKYTQNKKTKKILEAVTEHGNEILKVIDPRPKPALRTFSKSVKRALKKNKRKRKKKSVCSGGAATPVRLQFGEFCLFEVNRKGLEKEGWISVYLFSRPHSHCPPSSQRKFDPKSNRIEKETWPAGSWLNPFVFLFTFASLFFFFACSVSSGMRVADG